MVAEPGGPDRAEPPALLEGLKPTVKLGGKEIPVRPFAPAIDAARRYMESVGLGNRPRLRTYQPVDEARAKRIADAFESMEHNPSDPEVQAAYRALIDETLAQFQAIKDTGLKIEFLDGRGRDPKTGKDPYPLGPRQAIQDVHDNNHLWVFPTEGGFGTSDADVSGNPLLEMTDEVIDGKQRTANDVFRIVHDYFGHIAEGVGFRANGEENAWRLHSQMFSPEARRALTSETRGQNSWVNYGPHGEQNRNAPTEETIFADQKTGLLPQWVVDDGAHDPEEDLPDWVTEGTRAPAPEPSRKSPKARIGQNRFDNWYGYLGNRRVIEFGNSKTETAEQAAKRWLQEQEGGPRGGVMAEAKRFLSDEEGSVTIPSWLMPRRQYNNNNRVKTATELSGQSKPWRITMEDASGNDVSLLFKQHKDDDVTNIRDEISQEDAPGMLRDQLSYRVAEALGFDKLVPETEATEVGGLADAKAGGKLAKFGMVDDERATGSAMQWLDNVVEFGQLSEEDRKTAGTPLEWYQLNVLDFLIGQTDRHGRNLLVDKEPDADGVRHIHASDNTLSFPRISPEPGRPGMKGLRIVKHGAWNMAATPEERAAIVERLSQTDWSGVLEGLGEKAKQAFMDRLEFVKRHVEANTFHLPVRYSAAQWRD